MNAYIDWVPQCDQKYFKSLGQAFKGVFCAWQFFYLTLAIGQMKIAFEIEHQLTRRDILISLEWARPELKGPGLYFSPQYISLGLNPLLHKWATRASPK